MSLRRGTPAVLAAMAALVIAVVIGVSGGAWQLMVAALCLAVILATWGLLEKARSASKAIREIRTELRHIRDDSRQAVLLSNEQMSASNRDGDYIADLRGELSDLRSNLIDSHRAVAEDLRTAVIEQQSQLADLVASQTQLAVDFGRHLRLSVDSEDERTIARRELVDRLGVVADKVDEAHWLVAKTKQQLNRSVRRHGETYGLLELLEGKLTARIDYFTDEAHRELRRNRSEISALSRRLSELSPAQSPSPQPNAAANGEFDISGYLYYLSYQVPREIEALEQLNRLYRPGGHMPLLGGWALTPTGTLDIIDVISRDRPQAVVECGSGTSTLWLSMAARENGVGHVYALEHDPTFAEQTRTTLNHLGLREFATVIDAPIIGHETNSGQFDWYELEGLGDVPSIDLLVIDGPPQALGDLRGGALPLLSARFASSVHVFADDVNRPFEREMIEAWLEEYPELSVELSSTPVQAHLLWSALESR